MKLTMDLFYKQEETNQAMENMECWKTQEHLKECRKCAPVGNWKKIEEEFRKKFNPEIGSHDDDCECSDCVGVLDIDEVVNFFKPYFQEEMHDKAVEELEEHEMSNLEKQQHIKRLRQKEFTAKDLVSNANPLEKAVEELETVDNH